MIFHFCCSVVFKNLSCIQMHSYIDTSVVQCTVWLASLDLCAQMCSALHWAEFCYLSMPLLRYVPDTTALVAWGLLLCCVVFCVFMALHADRHYLFIFFKFFSGIQYSSKTCMSSSFGADWTHMGVPHFVTKYKI